MSSAESDTILEYPVLSTRPARNDFDVIKKSKLVLEQYKPHKIKKRAEEPLRVRQTEIQDSPTMGIELSISGEKESKTKPYDRIIQFGKDMKDKELRKTIASLESITMEKYKRMESVIRKRHDFSKKHFLQAERD